MSEELKPCCEKIAEQLKDAAKVHLNMLRGVIAKPSPAAIVHVYRGQAQALLDEVLSQNKDVLGDLVVLPKGVVDKTLGWINAALPLVKACEVSIYQDRDVSQAGAVIISKLTEAQGK